MLDFLYATYLSSYCLSFFRVTYCNSLGVYCFKTHVWGVPSSAFRERVEEVNTCCATRKTKYVFIPSQKTVSC